MSERLVLALAGPPGVGKTTLGNFAEDELGFTSIDGSSVIKQRAAEDGATLTDRASYTEYYRNAQSKYGETWISDYVLSQDGDRIASVGLRNKDDARNILNAHGIIIALVCPPEDCFARVNKNDPKQKSTLEEFIAMLDEEESTDEYGSHTNWVMQHATVSIDASKSLEHTKAALSQLVEHFSGQQM